MLFPSRQDTDRLKSKTVGFSLFGHSCQEAQQRRMKENNHDPGFINKEEEEGVSIEEQQSEIVFRIRILEQRLHRHEVQVSPLCLRPSPKSVRPSGHKGCKPPILSLAFVLSLSRSGHSKPTVSSIPLSGSRCTVFALVPFSYVHVHGPDFSRVHPDSS